MAKNVRTRIFIVQEPGSGKKYYRVIYWPGEIEPEVDPTLKTQKLILVECRAIAKKTGGASIYVQGKDARWKEVYSTPPVRNADERKRKKAA